MSVAKKPPLTLEQARKKKLGDWKLRRVLRLMQTRSQANENADCIRRNFWCEAYTTACEMDEVAAIEDRIEQELAQKRKEAADAKERQQKLAIHYHDNEEILKAERRRLAQFHTQRAKERFNEALQKEQAARLQDQCQSHSLLGERKMYRKMEDQIAAIRREAFRQKNQPVETIPVGRVRRDSIEPRGEIPLPSVLTPLRARELSVISSLSSVQESESAQISPVEGKTEKKERNTEADQRSSSPMSDGEFSVGNVDMEASIGSIVSMDKENVKPMLLVEDSAQTENWSSRRDVCISTHDSSSSSPRSSVRSLDSIALFRAANSRAIQLSPPKQPHRHPFHDLTRPRRISPLKKSPVSPRHKMSVSPRKAPHPTVLPSRNILKPRNLAERPEINQTANRERIMRDLQEVMDSLRLLDDLRPGIASDSFLTVSSGPLSSMEMGDILSDESWLSQQTMSNDTSFGRSGLTAESGTLFTTFSTILSQNSLADVYEPAQRELSLLGERN